MQFPYKGHTINLLDTPGHEDFSEDTYRTLTAVDSALMVIDGAKGVEERTIKLMEVCRMRDTPIISFVNKMDREIREPLELLDEIENVLNIRCVPHGHLVWVVTLLVYTIFLKINCMSTKQVLVQPLPILKYVMAIITPIFVKSW